MTDLSACGEAVSSVAPGEQDPRQRAAQVMAPIYVRGDRLMGLFLSGHLLIAIALAGFYNTWLPSLVIGAAALGMFMASARLLPGSFLTRCVAGVSLQTFVALHIYQLHGL